jgi:hypothetical protein
MMGVPFSATGFGLLFFEHLTGSARMRYGFCGLNILHAWFSLRHPTASPFFNYMIGLMSVVHVVRSVELLIASDPLSMKRLRKAGLYCYYWEPLPPPYSFRRLLWIIDNVSNLRGIGWSHGSARYLPPPSQIIEENSVSRPLKPTATWGPNRQSFLWTQVRRLVVAYLWFDFYHTMFVHENGRHMERLIDTTGKRMLGAYLAPATNQNIYNWLGRIARIISAQFFLDAAHAITALIAVGIITDTWLGTAGEPWAYPTLFGGFRLSTPNLKGRDFLASKGGYQDLAEPWLSEILLDFWANWWHDVLRRPFWTVAQWLVPHARSSARHIWAVFAMTGAAHAAASYNASRCALPAARVFVAYCLQPVATIYQKPIVQWFSSKRFVVPMARPIVLWAGEGLLSIVWLLCILPWQLDDPGQEAFFASMRPPYSVWHASCTV